MQGVLVAIIIVITIMWVKLKKLDSHIVTDRKEMRRLSKKLQSSETYKHCGEE